MPIHNEDIAAAFDEFADLLALSGENQFRIRAYRHAAEVLRSLSEPLSRRIAGGFDPDTLPGVGADLAGKIRELATTGRCAALERLRATVPPGLRELLFLPDVGPQRARALHEALDIRSLEDLRVAIEQHRVRKVPRFGVKLENRLAESLATLAQRGKRFHWSVADRYARALERHLASLPGVLQVAIAGSYRRGRETVGDLDVVVAAQPGTDVDSALRQYEETKATLVSGPTRSSVVLRNGLQVDLRVVPAASFGAALYYFTGSKDHNIRLRTQAAALGLKINEYGVFRGSECIGGSTEGSVLATLGLPYIEPELREDRGEFEAAVAGRLPRLIAGVDLRGDLHAHTSATDGTATLAGMARAARAAQLRYLAITDHSRYLGAVHGLDAAALAAQIGQIDAFNASARGITLLKGVEVDILEDGSLALPDEILGRLDLVVGAVHSHFTLSRRRQTERLLRALDHGYLSILAHPSARLIDQREPIDCDWPTVFRAAAERPCFLEINAQPSRLDLNDLMAREAASAGVRFCIASDAHGVGDFELLAGGVRQARRAWLEASQVINTQPLAQLRRTLRRTFLK
ncbi:MAG: DNA polymerase/3'-5' exonuclease PolX [Gammaproteobacteria bacterium]|nr:DNA polymerase/3'-5' exonuclease PolX [Gammaproteobacteria bacterium]